MKEETNLRERQIEREREREGVREKKIGWYIIRGDHRRGIKV